jgi:sugar phosphate isomerase/epimerase
MRHLGIFSWFGYPLPISERLELIAQAGFDTTSLWLEPDIHPEEPYLLADMPRLAQDMGLFLDYGHAPFEECNLLWSDTAADRQHVLDMYREHIAFCHRHQIPRLVLHLTKSNTPPPLNQAGLDTFAELLKYAEDVQVTLAVENTRHPGYGDVVFEQFESPYLGLCYDSSHDFLHGKPPGAILTRWGHVLATTHFSDNAGEHDDHWLPGEGIIDWNVVRDSFPTKTYTGVCLLEVFPQDRNVMTPEAFLELAYQQAYRLRQNICTPDRIHSF